MLLGLAECASRGHGLAFPSIAELVEFSSLDRKSVIANLDKLEKAGFIQDTGRKVGRTGQIKVYQLSVPKTEPSQKRNSSEIPANSPKNGTRNKSEPVKEAKASYQIAIDLWNELSPSSGIPAVRVLNNSRKQMFLAREKEHGLATMLEAVRRVHGSPWCRGQQGAHRKADIMYILQPKTLARVLEGFYGADRKKEQLDPTVLAQRKRDLADIYDMQGRGDEAAVLRREAATLVGQCATSLRAA